MTEPFEAGERLYRAVYPPEIMPMFWKENGEISSAVFKDKRGLSVERSGGREEETIMGDMRLFFSGMIVRVLAADCFACRAVVKYLPTKRSIFHSEIHGGEDRILLSQAQCKHLAKSAHVCE
ncbi:MAG: hypothetical protein MJ103_04070 [Saccharofermentans sp.]|nr:hypothetical protein [Saccharofermentans sp.]